MGFLRIISSFRLLASHRIR